MELPGRGTTFVRTVPGPPGAPTVLLLHGWTATADLNWFTCYHPLGRQFRVVALDHRGHGRGIRIAQAVPPRGLRRRCRRRAATCWASSGASPSATRWAARRPAAVEAPPAIASTAWCCAPPSATSRHRVKRSSASSASSGLAAVARLTPVQARRWLTEQLYLQRKTSAVGAVGRPGGQPARLAHGARSRARRSASFSSRDWIGEVDVPTSVVITMRDRVVPVRRQVRLFEAIPGAEAFRVDGDHDCGRRERRAFRAHAAAGCRQRRRARRGSAVGLVAIATMHSLTDHGEARSRRLRARRGRRRCASRSLRAGTTCGCSATSTSPSSALQVGSTYASTAARKVFATAERRVELDHERELKTAEAITERLGNMKGALMKLGQMASYVDEGLPAPLRAGTGPAAVERSADERRAGGRGDRARARRTAREGCSSSGIRNPIASASIGQVHRAVVVDPATGPRACGRGEGAVPGCRRCDRRRPAQRRSARRAAAQGFGGLDPDDMVAEIKERLTERAGLRGWRPTTSSAFADSLPRPSVHPRARRVAHAVDRAAC